MAISESKHQWRTIDKIKILFIFILLLFILNTERTFTLTRHDQQILHETIMYSVPGPVTIRASVPMECKRASVIRYAFSSTISSPRNAICTHGEVLNFRNIDVNIDEGVYFVFSILICYRE